MPRNSTGKYFLPAGNPVANGELITAKWANDTLSDIATAISDSLDRSGLGGLKSTLGVADGTQNKPGVNFTNEANTGLYRPSQNILGVSVGGVNVFNVAQTGIQMKPSKEILISQAPTQADSAANKKYVDDAISNLATAVGLEIDESTGDAESIAETNSKEYTDMEIQAVNNVLSTHRTDIDSNSTKITNVGDNVATLTSNIQTLQSSIGQLPQDVGSLQSEISTLNNSVSGLSSQVSGVTSSLNSKAPKSNPSFTGTATFRGSASFTQSTSFTGGILSQAYNFSSNSSIYSAAGDTQVDIAVGGGVRLKIDDVGDLLITGGLARKVGGGPWNTYSDARLKTNVQPLTSALDKLMQLKPVSYEWVVDKPLENTVGFLAQEVAKVFPNAVAEVDALEDEKPYVGEKTKVMGFNNDIFAYLIGAIQEQQAEIEALKLELRSK